VPAASEKPSAAASACGRVSGPRGAGLVGPRLLGQLERLRLVHAQRGDVAQQARDGGWQLQPLGEGDGAASDAAVARPGRHARRLAARLLVVGGEEGAFVVEQEPKSELGGRERESEEGGLTRLCRHGELCAHFQLAHGRAG